VDTGNGQATGDGRNGRLKRATGGDWGQTKRTLLAQRLQRFEADWATGRLGTGDWGQTKRTLLAQRLQRFEASFPVRYQTSVYSDARPYWGVWGARPSVLRGVFAFSAPIL
jgi:hypothetical protein